MENNIHNNEITSQIKSRNENSEFKKNNKRGKSFNYFLKIIDF
jgi:hypothetical protein